MSRPIFSAEAEQAVIARILIRPEQLDTAMDMVKPDDFYVVAHRNMFITLCEMGIANEQIDAVMLYDKMAAKGYEVELADICTMVSSTPAGNVNGYCASIKEHSDYRRLMFELTNMVNEYPENRQRAAELAADAQNRILALEGTKSRKKRSALDMLRSSIDRIDKIAQGLHDPMGVPYGIPSIDKMTMGAQTSQMVVIAARPGDGKTNAGIKVLRNAVFRQNKIGMMFSLEMEGEKIINRILASENNIPNVFFKDKDAASGGAHNFEKIGAFSTLHMDKLENKLHIYDEPEITPTQIRARCMAAKRQYGELGVVVIDYLQLVTPDRPTENRNNDVSAMSRFFKKMAMELCCPVVVLSQLNRAGASRSAKDNRPRVTDLRESGAIEQDADVIILLYREEMLNKKPENIGVAEFIIGKQREGETGIVAVEAAFAYSDFRELSLDRVAVYQGDMPLNNDAPVEAYNDF